MFRKFKTRLHIKLLKQFGTINRITLSAQYLKGQGLEIGAMDLPLKVKKRVSVKYLDRCAKEESEKIFPELKGKLVDVDIISDGETLAGVADNSYDFVIANHVLEHYSNPIRAIENMVRVVKRSGVIFLAIPDKRYTFDKDRALTTFEHLAHDYEAGPESGEQDHYVDFVKYTYWGEGKSENEILQVVRDLKKINFSIHYHVWIHETLLEMFLRLKKQYFFPYEIIAAVAATPGSNESVFIIKKI